MECKCYGKSLGKQRYKCKECGKTFFDTKPKMAKNAAATMPAFWPVVSVFD